MLLADGEGHAISLPCFRKVCLDSQLPSPLSYALQLLFLGFRALAASPFSFVEVVSCQVA